MTKKLFLYFTNEEGQSTTIQVQQPQQNLTADDVRQFMEKLIEMKLFRHKGQLKYAHIKGARYSGKESEVLI